MSWKKLLLIGTVVGAFAFAAAPESKASVRVGIGIGIPIAPNMVIDLGYEYLDLGEIRSGNSGTLTIGGVSTTAAAGPMKADLKAHTVQVSLRLGF